MSPQHLLTPPPTPRSAPGARPAPARVPARVVAAVVTLAALVGTACGISGGGPTDAGPGPTRSSTTTVATAPGEESTVPGAPGTTTGSSGGPATSRVTVYLTRGEGIVGVTRSVPRVARIGAEAVKALLAGPTAAESAEGLGTAIPTATRFRDLAIADGVARVDLSRDFESGGGTLSMTARLAQVTCTLDEFDSVRGVRFMLDGRLVNVFSGDGIPLDEPVSCDDYSALLEGGGSFPGIWPFTSRAEMDEYRQGSDRRFTDAEQTARLFAADYLGMREPVAFGPPSPAGPDRVEVGVGPGTGEGGRALPDPRRTTTVVLLRGGDGGPWTAVEARAERILLDSPGPQDRVSSPVPVTGRANAFEGNVIVEVRQDGMAFGEHLGRGFVTGAMGELGPFQGDIGFDPPGRPAGAVVLYEPPVAEGTGVLQATVVRVRF